MNGKHEERVLSGGLDGSSAIYAKQHTTPERRNHVEEADITGNNERNLE